MPAGRPKNIKSPEELWDYFIDYEEWLTDNVYKEQHWVGKDGDEVEKRIRRYPSWMGFEGYLSRLGVVYKLEDYRINRDGNYGEFSEVITRIRKITDGEVLSAALSGVANPSIAARLLGLTDKKEVDVKGGLNIPPLPDIGNRK